MGNELIAQRNDTFRSKMIPGKNRVILTPIVSDSPVRGQILSEVKKFKTFKEDDDPYGEHDFGSVKVNGQTYFWKIDYYDINLEYGCCPSDPECRLVLTIMHASEY